MSPEQFGKNFTRDMIDHRDCNTSLDLNENSDNVKIFYEQNTKGGTHLCVGEDQIVFAVGIIVNQFRRFQTRLPVNVALHLYFQFGPTHTAP